MIYYSILKAFKDMNDGQVLCVHLGYSSVRFIRVGDELIFEDERKDQRRVWKFPPENIAECYGDRCTCVTIEDNHLSIRFV